MSLKKYNTKQLKSKFKVKDDFDDLDLDIIDNTYFVDNKDIEEDEGEEEIVDENIDEDFYGDLIEPATDTDINEEEAAAIIALSTKPKKRGPKPTKLQYYVEPKEFDEEIIKYYENNNISNELALMINKIANKLSYAPNFINYTYRDEMVGDAVVRMMKALIAKKYTHSKGRNPFSYFTKIAFNAFRNRIKKEKYIHDTLQKYQEEIIMNNEYTNYVKNKLKHNTEETAIVEND